MLMAGGQVIDIIAHIDFIEAKLSLLDKGRRGKFAAWCGWYLFSRQDIRALLQEHLSQQCLALIEDAISITWSGADEVALQELLTVINKEDWIEEESRLMEDSGVRELLGAISSMLVGVIDNNPAYIANCAERVLNFIDYEVATSLETSTDEVYQHLMTQEMQLQSEFIDCLSSACPSVEINFERVNRY